MATDTGDKYVRQYTPDILDRLGQAVYGTSGVSEAGYSPSTSFSPAETYKLRADGYYNQGDTNLGDAYSALWKGSDAFSSTAKQMNDFYNIYGDDIARREMALAGIKSELANKLYDDMSETRSYVMNTFGPNGTLTNEINKYYDDLGNYLSTDAGRQAASIAAQGLHSGASLGAIRAQQNQAYNESFARYVQAKEQEINAKQTIASNLINYMSTLRQEYGDTTNAYIISQYQRANDLLNTISASIAQSNIELAGTKLNNALKGSSSSSSSTSLADLNLWQEFNKSYLNTDEKKKAFDGMSKTEQTNLFNQFKNQYYSSIFVNGGEQTNGEGEEGSNTFVISNNNG